MTFKNFFKKLLVATLVSQTFLLPVTSLAASSAKPNMESQEKVEELEYMNGAVYFNQAEPPYRDYPYGTGSFGVMINTGCGPVAMAMAASTILGEHISPIYLADFAKMTDNIMPFNGGTKWQFFTQASEQLNLKCTPTTSSEEAKKALQEGKVVINSVNNEKDAYWTQFGHFILLTQEKNGKIGVNDPAFRSKSKFHDPDLVFEPSKQMWIIEKN